MQVQYRRLLPTHVLSVLALSATASDIWCRELRSTLGARTVSRRKGRQPHASRISISRLNHVTTATYPRLCTLPQ